MRALHFLVFPAFLMLLASYFAQNGEEVQIELMENQASALNHASSCMNDVKQYSKGTPEDAVSIDRDYIIQAKPLWSLLEQIRLSPLDQRFFELVEKADVLLRLLPKERKGFGDANLCFVLGSQLIDILDYRLAKSRSAALLADQRSLLLAQSLDIADWLAAGKMTGFPRSLPARNKVNDQLKSDDEEPKRRIRALQ